MLSPEFLRDIADAVEEKAAALNRYLTCRIAKRIEKLFEKDGKVELIPSSRLDVKKMREAGKLEEEIQREITRKLPELEEEIKDAFYRTADEWSGETKKFTRDIVEFEQERGNLKELELPELSDYEKVGVTDEAQKRNITPKEARLMERAYKRTNGTIYNLTGTTAEACQTTFINAVDEAYWKATHGVSIHTAIAEAVGKCAKEGMYVTYPGGHKDRIEVAIARAVRTGVSQAAGDMVLARCAETGVNTVVVSSHPGARYTDQDEPANHMSWQGKVYTLDWNNEVLSKYRVKESEIKENEKRYGYLSKLRQFLKRKQSQSDGDFIEKTGYGTGEGLCGWNCRHSFSQFYEGININHNKDYNSPESRKRYDLEQQQRKKERSIRQQHREREAFKAAMDEAVDPDVKSALREKYELSRTKLNRMREDYADFCKANGLKEKAERLKIVKIPKEKTKNDIANG